MIRPDLHRELERVAALLEKHEGTTVTLVSKVLVGTSAGPLRVEISATDKPGITEMFFTQLAAPS